MSVKACCLAFVVFSLCITLASTAGNTANCCQVIFGGVADDVGWFVYAPPDVRIQCHRALMSQADNLDPNFTGWGWEINGCSAGTTGGVCDFNAGAGFCLDGTQGGGTDTPTPTYTDSFAGGCGNTGVLTRTWRSNSQCPDTGDFRLITQTITLEDTVPPTLAVPADLEVECPREEPDYFSNSHMNNFFGSPDVIDYCAFLTDNNIVQTFTTPNAAGTFTRTFTVSDSCNPNVVGVQTITFVDTTPPVLQRLPNQYLECTSAALPITTTPAAADNCYRSVGVLTPTSEDVIYAGSCAGKYSFVRTWTVTDLDGNTVQETQVIVVDDTTPPTIAPAPASTVNIFSVNCFSDILFPYTQQDEPAGCGGVASRIVPYEVSLSHNEDEGLTEVLVTYTSSDLCGNSETWADLWQVSSGLGVFSDVISGPTQLVDKGTVFTITIDVTATNACDPFGILVVDAGFATLVTASSDVCFFQAATGVIYCDPVPANPSVLTLDLIMPTTYLGSDLLISISWHYNYRTIGVLIGSYLVSFN